MNHPAETTQSPKVCCFQLYYAIIGQVLTILHSITADKTSQYTEI